MNLLKLSLCCNGKEKTLILAFATKKGGGGILTVILSFASGSDAARKRLSPSIFSSSKTSTTTALVRVLLSTQQRIRTKGNLEVLQARISLRENFLRLKESDQARPKFQPGWFFLEGEKESILIHITLCERISFKVERTYLCREELSPKLCCSFVRNGLFNINLFENLSRKKSRKLECKKKKKNLFEDPLFEDSLKGGPDVGVFCPALGDESSESLWRIFREFWANSVITYGHRQFFLILKHTLIRLFNIG